MPIFFTVPQAHCVVIERLGKFNRVVREGLHIKLPLIESIKHVYEWDGNANQHGWLIELSEQQTDTPVRQCQTKDNVDLLANASVFWRIVDAQRAVYETDKLPNFVRDVALNALRAHIGTLELDEIFQERQSLNERIAAELSETAKKWGIVFTRVEIQELNVKDETAAAMRQQMEAERRRRAVVAEAEGSASAELKVAEAHREATVMRAEGQAKALALIADAEANYLAKLREQTTPESATQILLAQKYIEGFGTISKNEAHKVFLPNSFQGMFAIDAERTK